MKEGIMTLDDIQKFLYEAPLEDLDKIRIMATSEQERREKVSQWPSDIANMAKDALAAGCDPEDLRSRFSAAIDASEPTE